MKIILTLILYSMNKIAITLISVLLFWGCSTSNNSSEKFLGLNGNIESIKDTEYSAEEKFGEVVLDEIEEVIVYKFDKAGNTIKQTTYDEDGNAEYTYEATFENNEWTGSSYKWAGSMRFFSNSSQRLVSKTEHSETVESLDENGNVSGSHESTYSPDKTYLKIINKDKNGVETSTTERYFDKNKNLLKVISGSSQATFKYDDKNRLVKESYIDLEYDFNDLTVYSYNKLVRGYKQKELNNSLSISCKTLSKSMP